MIVFLLATHNILTEQIIMQSSRFGLELTEFSASCYASLSSFGMKYDLTHNASWPSVSDIAIALAGRPRRTSA